MKNLYSENDKVEKRLKKTQQNGKYSMFMHWKNQHS